MNTTLAQNKSTSIAWLAAWAIASALGVAVGVFGILPLLWTYWENVEKTLGQMPAQLLGGTVFGLSLGLTVGVAQWLVLRGRAQNAARWLVGSIIGGGIAGAIAILLASRNEGGTNVMWTVIAFATLGAILGAGQFFAARSMARNPLWIAASAVGLGIGATSSFLSPDQDLSWLTILIGGIVYGAVTGAAMWWFAKE